MLPHKFRFKSAQLLRIHNATSVLSVSLEAALLFCTFVHALLAHNVRTRCVRFISARVQICVEMCVRPSSSPFQGATAHDAHTLTLCDGSAAHTHRNRHQRSTNCTLIIIIIIIVIHTSAHTLFTDSRGQNQLHAHSGDRSLDFVTSVQSSTVGVNEPATGVQRHAQYGQHARTHARCVLPIG